VTPETNPASSLKASQPKQPTREEFTHYWRGYDTFLWRDLLPYIVYLGGLALYAFVYHRIDAEGRFLLLALVGAAAYLVLLPYFSIRRVHKRNSKFFRCPQCGDWFREDASGAFFGPNPKFKSVIETGKCGKCGRQVLAD
jgi:hypothetical protein